MARHQELARRLNLRVYFADPHSPWQRPSNENANGLIRQYLPKGMDLCGVSQRRLILPSNGGHPVKRVSYATEVTHDKTSKAE
jgi:IS30 family transposase